MAEQTVVVRLNQQQQELLDRTVAEHPGSTRAELVRRALKEYHAEHGAAHDREDTHG